MRTTIHGEYPYEESEVGHAYRGAINRAEDPYGDGEVRRLARGVVAEFVDEVVSAGIGLPNYGFCDVNDVVTDTARLFENVRHNGMGKLADTNRHVDEANVYGQVRVKEGASILSPLYLHARSLYEKVKLEVPGLFSLADHSSLIKGAPYADLDDLAFDYAEGYSELLRKVDPSVVPLVQFDELSIAAKASDPSGEEMLPRLAILPELYRTALRGLSEDIPVYIHTFDGPLTEKKLEILQRTHADVIGIDFSWTPNAAEMIIDHSPEQGIGLGVIDSSDQVVRYFEDPQNAARFVSRLRDSINWEESFICPSSDLWHSDRADARRKVAILGETMRILENGGDS